MIFESYFLTKVAQIIGKFWVFLKNMFLLEKLRKQFKDEANHHATFLTLYKKLGLEIVFSDLKFQSQNMHCQK